MVFYISSAKELPLIAPQDWDEIETKEDGWQSKVVPFSVELLDETNRAVVEKFDQSEVRYAGSYEGCGCGFAGYENDEDFLEPDESQLAGRVSRQLLHNYILENSVSELYCCWSGDEDQPIEYKENLDPAKILDLRFDFKERGLYTISPRANKTTSLTSACGPRK